MESIMMRDGYEINYNYDSGIDPKASVIISHGFAEHMDRYEYFAEKLCSRGFNVLRYDLRGHGSNKDLGYVGKFENFTLDLEEMYSFLEKDLSSLPIFMMGHSMGGLITVSYGIKNPEKAKGQILSGPVLGLLPSAKGKNKSSMKILSKLAGRLQLKNPIDEGLCGDIQVFRDYISDPKVLSKATLNLYYQFLFEGIEILDEETEDYKYPCIICHGEKDPIVPAELSRSFFEKISSDDRKMNVYEGLYHEILNEKTKDLVIEDMVHWIEDRI